MNFSSIWSKVKSLIFPDAVVQREFGEYPEVSTTMEQNISLWYSMYMGHPPWETKDIAPLGLPSAICREITRLAFSEFDCSVSSGARADFLNEIMLENKSRFYSGLEIGLALGGVTFKPYVEGGRIYIDTVSAASFQPTKFSPDGKCIGGAFKGGLVKIAGEYFIRLETHELTGTTYTVKNKAYRSDKDGNVGDEVPLYTVPEWADLLPETVIENVEGPLFAYFKAPTANNIDLTSRVGISVYGGAAVALIKQADEQWETLRWEFESGVRKVFMDGTETTAGMFNSRMYEVGPFSAKGEMFQFIEPTLRNSEIYAGFQNILKQIEFQVGLSYGTISDPQTVEKTATEIRSSKQRMFVMIDSIQKSLEQAFDSLIYAMDVYATLYGLAPAGTYEAAYDWGDSILDDADERERERANDRQDLASGIMNAWEYRMKWYGETEEEAKASLPGMEELTTEPEEEIE